MLYLINVLLAVHFSDNEYFIFNGDSSNTRFYKNRTFAVLETEECNNTNIFIAPLPDGQFLFTLLNLIDGLNITQLDNESWNSDFNFEEFTFKSLMELQYPECLCLHDPCEGDTVKYYILYLACVIIVYLAWYSCVISRRR